MVLLPVTVHGEVSTLLVEDIAFGLSLDEPLPDKIKGTKYCIGIVTAFLGAPATYDNRLSLSVGPGDHYVIFGLDPEGVFGIVIDWYSLSITLSGHTVSKSFSATEAKKYDYIAFNVDRNGNVSILSSGTIEPGSAPIVSPGGGSITSIGQVMNNIMPVMVEMITYLMPIYMMGAMLNMMMSMIGGMFRI